MDAVKDFEVALGEVDALLALATAAGEHSPNRPALIKASLLLLTTKVECFFESIVEEYCELVSQHHSTFHLPLALRVGMSRRIFLDAKLECEHIGFQLAAQKFSAISEFWTGKSPCPQVLVDSKFSYGKHGEAQVVKLFRRIGIDNVFEKFPVESEVESMANQGGPTSIAPDFNSLTSIRNNITHSDATPSLAEADVASRKRRLLLFAGALGDYLEGTLISAGDHFEI